MPFSTIAQQAGDVRSRIRQALVGMLAFLASAAQETISAVNSVGQQVQVGTITVNAAVDNTDYTWTIEGIEFTVNSGVGATVTSIALQIVAAINDEPAVRAVLVPTSALGVVTLTGITPGRDFTASDADANLTTVEASTAAADAEEIPFGRLLVQTGYTANGSLKAGLPVSTLLVAAVKTLTVTYAAGERYTVTIGVGGQSYEVDVLADTDSNTTAAAISAAINAILPANTVLSTVATNVVTLTSEINGQPFTVGIGLVSGTASRLVLAATVDSVLSDINRAAAGISVLRQDIAYETAGATEVNYPANAAMELLKRGAIWVENSQGVSPMDPVYVAVSGANAGLFFNTGSSSRILLPNARWVRAERTGNGQNIALLAWN
jgi:phage tail sheath gpL-like